jgi:glycosyltransferase involved in cell wall biosynthesis
VPNAPTPLVTIGIPVHDGARFLDRAVRSVLAQTLGDFELLIADNASGDATPALCEAWARRDPRVRWWRQPRNIGAPRNWNDLVHQARGRYFKWASANDLCAPTLLERCVATLEAEPSLVLCHGLTRLVDEDGRPQGVFRGDLSIEDPSPARRFETACMRLSLNNAMCGVIRTAVLRETRLDRLYPAGDMVLMAELALRGGFRLLDEVLLDRCQGPNTFTAMRTPLQIQQLHDPDARRALICLHWRRHADRLRCVATAPISWPERWRAAGLALRMALWDRQHLGGELRRAIAGAWR